MLKLKFKKLDKNALIPQFAHKTDAAFDLVSIENSSLKPLQRKAISLGIASEIPDGFFVSIRDRSGLAIKNGIHVLGGVIDAGFRGEWKVILINLSSDFYKIKKGERVAQGVLHKLPQVDIIEVDNLSDADRGDAGFGSSGK